MEGSVGNVPLQHVIRLSRLAIGIRHLAASHCGTAARRVGTAVRRMTERSSSLQGKQTTAYGTVPRGLPSRFPESQVDRIVGNMGRVVTDAGGLHSFRSVRYACLLRPVVVVGDPQRPCTEGRPDSAFQQFNTVGFRNSRRFRSSILAACFLTT